MRKIFLDCGAHDGCSVRSFKELYYDYNEYEIYSFECDNNRFTKLVETGDMLQLDNFYPIKKAIWINNGRKLFDGWQLQDTSIDDDENGIDALDLSQFILDNFDKTDYIVLKMDIEGAEYKVIDKMYRDASLSYISKFYGELHGPKKGYSIEDNNKLINQVWDCELKLLNWDALDSDNLKRIEIVPLNTPGSFTNHSTPRVGHAYRNL